jgi:hypothetical protein
MTKYKTIKITSDSPESLIKKIEKKGISIGSYAKETALKIPKWKEETFDVGIATVKEFGFTECPTTTQLLEKIKSFGYELCPPQTGLYLRLNDYDQEVGWYYVAMEPITGSGGRPIVFIVERLDDGERWLYTYWTDPYAQWNLDYLFVFRLRKSSDLSTSEPLKSDSLTLGHSALCPHCNIEIKLNI